MNIVIFIRFSPQYCQIQNLPRHCTEQKSSQSKSKRKTLPSSPYRKFLEVLEVPKTMSLEDPFFVVKE